MPRYIDADVAMDAANRLSLGETDAVRLSMRIVDYLNRIPPTADVAPVRHGEWADDASCPFCGFKPWYENDIHTLSFCPNCGAKMDKEGE